MELPAALRFVRAIGEVVENRIKDGGDFGKFFIFYLQKKTKHGLLFIEKQKDFLVDFLLMKRGKYDRAFLHTFMVGSITAAVVLAPFIADTFPVFSPKSSVLTPTAASAETAISVDTSVFSTKISAKPRDKAIVYTVEKGDTLSTVADKFDVSMNTIRWANDLTDDTLTVGDTLKIPPVTGILHKVAAGDTVYTIAKTYNTDAQKIVNFPFNNFANPETFALVIGEVLMVPDGIKPSEQQTVKQQTYVVSAPIGNVAPSGGYSWPLYGVIGQLPIWYHMALDIDVPIGTPIKATKDGVVRNAFYSGWNGGYALHVILDHGDGMSSLYAHMSAVYVHPGERVIGGQTVIGLSGNTGNSTGPHLHFEIRRNDVTQNPLSYLGK